VASARYQPKWDHAETASGERARLDADEFCTAAWREWLTAMVVVEMSRSEARVSWH
jgi:hypothetical protein